MEQAGIVMKCKCPKCQSENVARILYGLPVMDSELEKAMESGKIVLGGCTIIEDDPSYRCDNCGKEF